MEVVDRERLAIAEACNVQMRPLYQFLAKAYPPFDNASVSNLYEWFRSRMRSSDGQIHLEAVPGPTSFHVRLIEEDIPYGMVPLEGLGRLVGVPTPATSMFIDEACEILDVDYRLAGRSIDKMETEVRASLSNNGVTLDD
jgi:opine dehydrogenase